MHVLIVASGHLSATTDVARKLARALPCETTVVDTSSAPSVSFGRYDAIVFGTNVRMMLFHPRFFTYVRRWKKSRIQVPVFGYVCGVDRPRAETYCMRVARAIAPGTRVRFVGGVLDPSKASGLALALIQDYRKRLRTTGRPMPELDDAQIRLLAADICARLEMRCICCDAAESASEND